MTEWGGANQQLVVRGLPPPNPLPTSIKNYIGKTNKLKFYGEIGDGFGESVGDVDGDGDGEGDGDLI